ncbi:hypothetical protein LAZ67_8001418 [Cordylochernes scorpioides]|uniref:Uncharacterized protein n=1 Tax=Cordylochernes scorpioides TaxID=51811 RepID=A0ABY6KRT1_9ARAC|nr:hypothetical protein LAZ67_8001418 [Cordylochernes scorpioides]
MGGKTTRILKSSIDDSNQIEEKFVKITIKGAEGQIIRLSEDFRRLIKVPMLASRGPIIRVANSKCVKSIGRCALRINLNELIQPFEFIVLTECSHNVNLGWDFLKLTRAKIIVGKNNSSRRDTESNRSTQADHRFARRPDKRGNFRRLIKVPMLASRGPIIRVANSKCVKSIGRCALRINLNELIQPFEFIVLTECSHNVNLGWDFLKLTRAKIIVGKVSFT